MRDYEWLIAENNSDIDSDSESEISVNYPGTPIMADKDILEFVQSSKTIIDADSDDKNEMNNAAPGPASSELRNVMKSMCSYLDADSDDEMNNKMDEIDQYVDNLML
ncbi:hypothetical protein TNCV_1722751 [Trichonephila clavipes]|nr:hypothetical protein TNCV_1722751 [Trichonephila clavipes]